MDQSNVLRLNQAAIDAIRATGARSQYIFVEGNQWTGAWSWVDVNDSMKQLTDPENKLVFEMHQYLDSDSSGTNQNCVSTTIGEERVRSATQWLRSNGKKGIIGEFAGANNQVCQQAVRGLLTYLAANSDVWMGALWWAAGPWWATYMYSIEVDTQQLTSPSGLPPANLLLAPKRPGIPIHVHPRAILQSRPGDHHDHRDPN
jgi:endoglucanase